MQKKYKLTIDVDIDQL